VLNVLNSIVKPFNDDNLMAIKPLKCIFALNYIIIIRMNNPVTGFSKPSKEEKINWIAKEYFSTPSEAILYYKTIGTQMKSTKATDDVH
jgi:hypothetical protein